MVADGNHTQDNDTSGEIVRNREEKHEIRGELLSRVEAANPMGDNCVLAPRALLGNFGVLRDKDQREVELNSKEGFAVGLGERRLRTKHSCQLRSWCVGYDQG